MPLKKCRQEHTHREFKLWNAWLDERWYQPTRSDYLLMRIAQRVQQVLAKNPNAIKLEHQEVFSRPKKPKRLSAKAKEAIVTSSKSVWFAVTGLKGKERGR